MSRSPGTRARPPSMLCALLAIAGCGQSQDTAGGEILSGPTVVTFTTYTDADCTELPAADSVVHLDTTVDCNVAPDSSISELVCLEDRITYTNHPNSDDCSSDGISNELMVGVCQEFPGPAATWKLIEAEHYACTGGAR